MAVQSRIEFPGIYYWADNSDDAVVTGYLAQFYEWNKCTGNIGNDTVYGYGWGYNCLSGGSGNDYLEIASATQYGNCLYGGSGNDSIKGNNSGDTIDGGNGNDTIYGMGGNDTITDPSGNNKIYGGYGSDSIKGGLGSDTIYGENNNDTISGGDDGRDYIDGGDGNDKISANKNSSLFGGDGNDTIESLGGQNKISGGAGQDYIFSTSGNDTIYSYDGDDSIVCSGPNNYIESGLGNDNIILSNGLNTTLYCSEGADRIYGFKLSGSDLHGDEGNDVFDVSGINYRIEGGSGNDLIKFVNTDASSNNGPWIYGGDGNDTIIASGEPGSFIYADKGKDVIDFGNSRGTNISYVSWENSDSNHGLDTIKNFRSNSNNIVELDGLCDPSKDYATVNPHWASSNSDHSYGAVHLFQKTYFIAAYLTIDGGPTGQFKIYFEDSDPLTTSMFRITSSGN